MTIKGVLGLKKGLQSDFNNHHKKFVDDYIDDHLNLYSA